MTFLRLYADERYWADSGILVIRDEVIGDPDPALGELFAEGAIGSQPGGTIATAGSGWLWARTSGADGDHHVRLESHDGVPPDDRSGWDDVVETPYHSGSGAAQLGWLTAEGGEGSLLLGPPGLYRVRASCCRGSADEGDTWRLQFWPVTGISEPPRWLARSNPAAQDESSDWEQVLDYDIRTVLWGAQLAVAGHQDGASAAQIAAARPPYLGGQSAGTRPADPVWEPAPSAPLTTGHPDRDADEAQIYAEILADRECRERKLGEIAAQLGIPAPDTVAGVLGLLVKAGLLTAHDMRGELRYRLVADPPRAQDVLTWPAGQLAELDRLEAFSRYAALAADLVAVALWTSGWHASAIADLAERLLVPPAQVRAALRYATREQLISVDGDPDDASALLTLTVLARRDEEPAMRPVVAIPVLLAETVGLPEGAPPRAGIVTSSGDLVAWPGGAAVVLARSPGRETFRAVETAYGIVLLSFEDAVLVRTDGRTDLLSTNIDLRAALSENGRHLALTQSRLGRQPQSWLHVIDLADGSRRTLDWPGGDLRIAGFYEGAVSFTTDQGVSMRWDVGGEPEPLPWELRTIDTLTGIALAEGGDCGHLVISPGGEPKNVPVTKTAELAPGGAHLYDLRYEPPALTLFDIAAGGADPRIWWLPAGSEVSPAGPGHPVWEDTGHMLFALRPNADMAAVRLDVRTGNLEHVPLTVTPSAESDLAIFVEPLLRA